MKPPRHTASSAEDAFEASLREALHEELRAPPEHGFTEALLARLPRRKPRGSAWRWAPCVGALVGGAVFALGSPAIRDALSRLPDANSGLGLPALAPWLPLILTGLVFSGLSMLERR